MTMLRVNCAIYGYSTPGEQLPEYHYTGVTVDKKKIVGKTLWKDKLKKQLKIITTNLNFSIYE